MNSGVPRDLNTTNKEATVGPSCHSLFKSRPNAVDHLGHAMASFGIHGKPGPPHDIDRNRPHLLDFPVFNGNEADAFGTRLPDMPPLDVPGEDNVGPLVKNCRLVNMSERPVGVTFFDEFVESAWSIVGMAPHAP